MPKNRRNSIIFKDQTQGIEQSRRDDKSSAQPFATTKSGKAIEKGGLYTHAWNKHQYEFADLKDFETKFHDLLRKHDPVQSDSRAGQHRWCVADTTAQKPRLEIYLKKQSECFQVCTMFHRGWSKKKHSIRRILPMKAKQTNSPP